jgi:GST-like protein
MITLYSHSSFNGFRAAIMLNETGVEHELKVMDFGAREHKADWFLRLNPAGKIPVIVDDAPDTGPIVVSETLAIALYLSEKSGLLMPENKAERAKAWQWGSIVTGEFQAAFRLIFVGKSLEAACRTPALDRGLGDAAVYFKAMDQALAENPYLAGATYSFADVLAAPILLSTVPRLGLDMAPYENIGRWKTAVSQRPAVIKGMAPFH